MQEIDVAWLRKIGVPGSEQELRKLADAVYDVLELRVGNTITKFLNNEQLAELETMVESGAGEDVLLPWLEIAYPAYKQVVTAETASLRRGILRSQDRAAYILRQK